MALWLRRSLRVREGPGSIPAVGLDCPGLARVCLHTEGDNIHPMQPSHAEDDRLHNSDVAMQQAKIARCQV